MNSPTSTATANQQKSLGHAIAEMIILQATRQGAARTVLLLDASRASALQFSPQEECSWHTREASVAHYAATSTPPPSVKPEQVLIWRMLIQLQLTDDKQLARVMRRMWPQYPIKYERLRGKYVHVGIKT